VFIKSMGDRQQMRQGWGGGLHKKMRKSIKIIGNPAEETTPKKKELVG
jgi:hypothetical protein